MESALAAEIITEENRKDVELIQKLYQTTFFDEISKDDIRKTEWLLNKYAVMVDLIKNYEFAVQHTENGMNEYELLAAEGTIPAHNITSFLY